MKRLVLLAVCLIVWMELPQSAVAHSHGGVRVSFGLFHSSLASHGGWVFIEGGVRAWRPMHVPVHWRPYTVGRWIWTDDGWYWLSNEPWAWAVYHYGRWEYDDAYGWIWIPGYDWAPAWVEWRIGPSYIGWAPLGMAAVFEAGYGLRYAHSWMAPSRCWTFVDIRYVDAPDVYRHAYPVGVNGRYLERSIRGGDIGVERGRIVTRGPGREYVEGKLGRSVRRGESVDASDRREGGERREGGRDIPHVYRPGGENRGSERSGGSVAPERNRDAGWDFQERSRNAQSGRRSSDVDRQPQSLGRASVPDHSSRERESGVNRRAREVQRPSEVVPQGRPEQAPRFDRGSSPERERGSRSAELGRRAEKREEERSPMGERGRRHGS